MYARNLIEIDHDPDRNQDAQAIAEMRRNIGEGDSYLVRNVIPPAQVNQIRAYLSGIGRHSLPNYESIREGCPNFHRVNVWDSRAHVKGCFHQFSFFPWNQDVFGLFDITRNTFGIKNLLNGIPERKFLDSKPVDGCTARLSFQFYPSGGGGLHMHTDPVDHHQLTASMLIMTNKGEDFGSGGGYVALDEKTKLYFDDYARCGDVVHMNASVYHGVESIDPEDDLDWLSFKGRWICIFAVNKVAGNTSIVESTDVANAGQAVVAKGAGNRAVHAGVDYAAPVTSVLE